MPAAGISVGKAFLFNKFLACVKPVTRTCFLFSVCENRNTKTAVPGAGISVIESGREGGN